MQRALCARGWGTVCNLLSRTPSPGMLKSISATFSHLVCRFGEIGVGHLYILVQSKICIGLTRAERALPTAPAEVSAGPSWLADGRCETCRTHRPIGTVIVITGPGNNVPIVFLHAFKPPVQFRSLRQRQRHCRPKAT